MGVKTKGAKCVHLMCIGGLGEVLFLCIDVRFRVKEWRKRVDWVWNLIEIGACEAV